MHLRKLWLLAGVVLAALAVVTTGSASQQSAQAGYEDIKSSRIINKKTVRFTFSKPFAGWKTLFGAQAVMPSFAVSGEDFNKVWINDMNNPKDGKPISGGPFYLPNGGWDRGKQ